MSRVGVVVPVYNVAAYLEPCLASIAAQTHTDLDVLVVDDGSTDDSAEIAARFCESDPRFRLVQQPNGGLGNARNNGMAQVTGDLLAFVDSDDLLPPRAYEQLVGALDATTSDFATGSFRRLDSTGSRPAYFVSAAFAQRREAEHIRRFHPLVVDRTAWNKLFRRAFWDRHGFRFAEGVQYEDQYATLPAYFLASSVEVLSAAVYYWRIRDDGDRSITQGREEPRAVRDRLTAIRWTSDWLVANGFAEDKAWYDASVFGQDLVYVPEVLAGADEAERAALVALLDGYLATTGPQVHDGLPAVDRLAWHHVREHRWGALREVLRFKSDELARSRPVRRLRHWYVDAPGRRDRSLPRELFRIDDEIEVVSRVARLTAEGGRLRVDGWACLAHLGAGSEGAQSVQVRAVDDTGRSVDLDVRTVARPDLAAVEPAVAAETHWAGYVATLDPAALTDDMAERPEAVSAPVDWRLVVEVTSRGVNRSAEGHSAARLCAVRGATVPLTAGRRLRAELAGDRVLLHVERAGPVLTGARLDGDGTLLLEGRGARGSATTGSLRLSGAADKKSSWPVEIADPDRAFTARLPLADLVSDLQLPTAPQTLRRQALEQWDLTLRVGKTSARPLLAPGLADVDWTVGPRTWALGTNRPGVAVLVEREPRPVFGHVAIAADGTVTFRGEPGDRWPDGELLLDDGHGRTLPVERSIDAATGAPRATAPAPPHDGATWDVVVRRPGPDGRVAPGAPGAPGGLAPGAPGGPVPCAVTEDLVNVLPLASGVADGVVVGVRGRDGPVVYR